jgi:hypothetical protein
VAEQQGYIYRRQQVPAAELHGLLGEDAKGWAATSIELWRVSGSQEFGYEGRATVGVQEFRWRSTVGVQEFHGRSAGDDTYDVLCLSLSAEAPCGFEPLPGQPRWSVRPTTCREPGQERAPYTDPEIPALAFLAPNGAVQFVAQIDASTREGA